VSRREWLPNNDTEDLLPDRAPRSHRARAIPARPQQEPGRHSHWLCGERWRFQQCAIVVEHPGLCLWQRRQFRGRGHHRPDRGPDIIAAVRYRHAATHAAARYSHAMLTKCRGVCELSAGLGIAILGKPKSVAALFSSPADSDRIDHHMWAWPLADIQPWTPPQPTRGAHGFWNWPGQAEARGRR
jgi:hypothetical protein